MGHTLLHRYIAQGPFVLLAWLALFMFAACQPDKGGKAASWNNHSEVFDSLKKEILKEDTADMREKIANVKDMPCYQKDFLYALLEYTTDRNIGKALGLLERNYSSGAVQKNPVVKIDYLKLLQSITFADQDYSECQRYSAVGMELAKKQNDSIAYHLFLFQQGASLNRNGQCEQGIQLMSKALDWLEKTPLDENYYERPTYYYNELSEAFGRFGRVQDAINVTLREINELEHPSELFRNNHNPKFLDEERAIIFSRMATFYAIQHKEAEANHYISEFQKTKVAKTTTGRRLLANYYYVKDDYQGLLSNARAIRADIRRPAVPDYMLAEWLEHHYEAARHVGDTKEAIASGWRIINLHKQMIDRMGRKQYERYGVIYHLQDKEQHIMDLTTAYRNNLLYIFLLICGLGAIIFLTVRSIRSRKKTIAYNKQMTRYITERVKEDDAFHQKVTDHQTNESKLSPIAAQVLNKEKERRMQRIKTYLEKSRLYLQKFANYRDVAQGMGITQKRLQETISMGEMRSLVNDMRLAFACRMLHEHSEMTIQAIADDSGFGSLRTFQYAFKKKYGMTPDEYRRQINEEKTEKDITMPEGNNDSKGGHTLPVLLLVCLLVSILAGCARHNDDNKGQRTLDYDSLVNILDRDSSIVEPLILKAQAMGTINHAEAVLLEANRIYLSDGDYDRGLELLESNYHSEAVENDPKLKIHYIKGLESLAYLNEEYSACIRYCNDGINYARTYDDDTLYQYFSFDIGSSMFFTRMKDRGIFLMKRSLENTDRKYHTDNIDNLVYQYGTLANCLKEVGRYQEALDMSERQIQCLDELVHQDAIPYQANYPIVERAGNALFRANVYALMGNRAEAEKWLAKFFSNPASKLTRERFDLNDYYFNTGQYRKMLENMHWIGKDSTITHIPENTLAKWREYRLIAGMKLHDDTLTLQSADNLIAIQKKIINDVRTKQYANWASQFRAFDRDLLQQEMSNRRTTSRAITTGLIVVLVIASGILILNARSRRLAKERSRMLSKFVDDAKKDEERRKARIMPANHKPAVKTEPVAVAKEDTKPKTIAESKSAMQPEVKTKTESATDDKKETTNNSSDGITQEDILQFLEDSQCYHDTKITVKELAEYMKVAQKTIRELISPSELHDTVNKLRLRDACSLLYNQPDYTVQAVSEECGFGSLRAFQYAFKNEYGMSPADYRKSASEES